MPVSLRGQALAALEARLATVPGYTVLRNLDRELRVAEQPALLMFDGGEEVDDELSGGGILVLRTRAAVQIVLRPEPHQAIGPALDEALAQLRWTLAQDRQLGGLVADLRFAGSDDPVLPDELSGDVPRASITADFVLIRQEADGDPYAFQ